MDFTPTEEQLAVQRTARDFAMQEVLPKAAEIDREHRHPAELVKRMAELGFLGMAVPEQHGGAGPRSRVVRVLAIEEISAQACGFDRRDHVGHQLAGVRSDPPLRDRRAETPSGSSRSRRASCSAASHSASPRPSGLRAAQRTTATRWRGRLAARWHQELDHERAGRRCLRAVRDERSRRRSQGDHGVHRADDDQGRAVRRARRQKLGIRGSKSSQIVLDDVRLPAGALLGGVGDGFKVANVDARR